MNHGSLFSGIEGFDLAASWMGWDNILSCEINPFGRKILEHYWPDSYHHDDIKTLTIETLKKNKMEPFSRQYCLRRIQASEIRMDFKNEHSKQLEKLPNSIPDLWGK